ncbi:MAG: nuclear transport factor 2 family protein, partial [Halothiobacillaceae bacterium]|nr:nuclear transport factor 2 family protein [Halothiobacillaceae bacterium]
KQNIELVKKGYEAFARGDMETLMNLFDHNIEWIQPGESAISGTYHGKAGIAEHLSRLAEKAPTVTPRRFLADGDTVMVLTETLVGGETGEDAEVYTIRDGTVVRVQVYADTALMERQYGRKRVTSG